MTTKIKAPTLSKGRMYKAFEAVTSTPVDAEIFSKMHNVSIHVLRQSKQRDETGIKPPVHCKKIDGKLKIWRE